MEARTESLNQQVKLLSEQNLLKSLSHVLFDWAVIAAIIFVVESAFSIPLYILAVMLIANRQHGLLILMHDASHFRFSRNRKLNDMVAELFTAWPLFIRMLAYRERHLAHHKHTNTALDPDFRSERYPQKRGQILKMLIRDALALNTLEQFREIKRLSVQTSVSYKRFRLLFYVVLFSGITLLGVWPEFLMYWIVPAFTWLKVCLRLRSVADHTGLQAKPAPFDTRTVVPNLFDRLFLAPHSSSYHFGHHNYAAVPCYNLKKLHALLMKSDMGPQIHVTNGFIGLLKEFPRNAAEIPLTEKTYGLSFTKNLPISG